MLTSLNLPFLFHTHMPCSFISVKWTFGFCRHFSHIHFSYKLYVSLWCDCYNIDFIAQISSIFVDVHLPDRNSLNQGSTKHADQYNVCDVVWIPLLATPANQSLVSPTRLYAALCMLGLKKTTNSLSKKRHSSFSQP